VQHRKTDFGHLLVLDPGDELIGSITDNPKLMRLEGGT
jgi:hypothetical protein